MKGSSNECPSPAALDRAFSDGRGDQLQTHLRSCPECAAAWAKLEWLSAAAKSLSVSTLSSDEKDLARSKLLVESRQFSEQQPVRRRRSWTIRAVVAASTLATAAALGLALWSPGPPKQKATTSSDADTVYRGTLHPQPRAHYARVSSQPDEIVRLYDGMLTLQVEPLQPGERFRVITGDAEVEVHGTIFDVRAAGDRLEHVRVLRGRVEVRRERAPSLLLGQGEQWSAPIPTQPKGLLASKETASAHDLAPVAETPRTGMPQGPNGPNPQQSIVAAPTTSARGGSAPATSARDVVGSPPPSASPAELAFQNGFAALKAGDDSRAAKLFGEVGVGSSVSEDAAYWRAVAMARAGRKSEAIAAYRSFLQLCPRSARRGEASAALGWLLYERGDVTAAARHFSDAAKDPDQRVRSSATRGLKEATTVP